MRDWTFATSEHFVRLLFLFPKMKGFHIATIFGIFPFYNSKCVREIFHEQVVNNETWQTIPMDYCFRCFVHLFGIFLTQVHSVQAKFSNMHVATVLLRVEREIMQKSPAGLYYESLFWKHYNELIQISLNHPENEEEFWRVNRLFVPGLEALLDGKGDTVRINLEQIQSLEKELDWLASVGSRSLREDIEKEQQRFPLDKFVGMTMIEALDFINSNWAPEMQNVASKSDGKWSFYVLNGVYLEYPTGYYFQLPENSSADTVNFMTSTGVPEQQASSVIAVSIWRVSVAEKDKLGPERWYPAESIIWKKVIQHDGFEGVEFISSPTLPNSPIYFLDAIQYNQENQLAIFIHVYTNENLPVSDDFDYSTMINQRYEYFQHMVDHIHMQTP